MLKKFLDTISNFFSSLFGQRSEKPTPPPSPQFDKAPDLIEDSSDVPVDTVVTVVEIDIPGPFADPDKEGAFEDPDPEIVIVDPPVVVVVDPVPPSPTEPPKPSEPPVEPPAPAQKGRYLWCLDNGHGKLQAGKRSPLFDDGETRFLEYEFNRDIVERIMKALDKKGVKYFDVVPDYLTVGSFLSERVERANKKQSDLPKIYVSVHANAGPAPDAESWINDSIKGAETWYAHNSTKGKKIAAVFQKHIVAQTGMKNRNLKSTAEKSLYVLTKTSMPAILTENGFYNNKEEAAKLMRNDFRQKIADAHIAAILEIEKEGI